jgi:hypothetical protein
MGEYSPNLVTLFKSLKLSISALRQNFVQTRELVALRFDVENQGWVM